MSDTPKFQRIIASSLEFETPAEESDFCMHVLREVEFQRRNMGWEKDRGYRPGSFLHRLDTFQKKYEQDYDYRATKDMLFRESNLALNPILTQVNQNSDRFSNDVLGSAQFFTVKPEGSEDQPPVQAPQPLIGPDGQPVVDAGGMPVSAPKPPNPYDVYKDILHNRSQKINLHEIGKDAAKGTFIRGQEVVLTSFSTNAYERPKKISVIKVDGKMIKDTRGVPVIDEDVWISNPANPDEIILEREIDLPEKIRLPANVVMQTGNPKVIMQYEQDSPGADAKVVYYGDFFWAMNAPSLDESYIKGHAFRSNVGDLVMAYPPESRLPAATEYLELARTNQLPESSEGDYTVQADVARPRQGEDEDLMLEKSVNSSECGFKRRSYYHVVLRYDADKNGVAEDIYCVIDINAQRVIHYEYAAFVFPWDKRQHPHPYVMFRIWKKLSRATGTGLYELLEAFETVMDRMWNRIEIDASTSGNVLFENPQATMEGIDGEGIQFRTREAYQLRNGFTAQDALQTVTVNPANLDVFNTMLERAYGRIELTGGTVSPQDSSVADVPGQDTLGVAKILENTSNQSLRARESEILVGLTALLYNVADIEAWSALQDDHLELLVKQIGEEKAAILIDWLKSIPDGDWRNGIEVNLSKSSSSQMVEIGNAIIGTLERWIAVPTPYKDFMKSAYAQILSGLDVPNPDQMLDVEAAKQADMQIGMAQAATEQQTQLA